VVHQLSRDYICALCGKDYSSAGGLSVHMAVEHGPAKQPIKCDMCNMTFKIVARLKAHKRKQHSGVVTCEHCGKTFKNKVGYFFVVYKSLN
jgi:transcription elongation factor Elf1